MEGPKTWGLFYPMKTLLLRPLCPLGLAKVDTVGFSLGAGPEDIPRWYFEKTCLHLTEQNNRQVPEQKET